MYNFLRFPGFKMKAVTLNYDDGTVFDKKLIEIMTQYGLKGTFNLNSGNFGKGRVMPVEDALALYEQNGMEVACHGLKHWALTELNNTQAVKELLDDRINMEKLFGHLVPGLAYANGRINAEKAAIVKELGFHYSRTTVSTEKFDLPSDWIQMPATCKHTNPRLMELCDTFLAPKDEGRIWSRKAQWFLLWGHSYEFNDDDNWNVIEDFAKKMGNRDDVWYATTGEVYDYVRAYHSLEYSADGSFFVNPTAIDVYLCYFGTQILVPAGGTAKAPEKA